MKRRIGEEEEEEEGSGRERGIRVKWKCGWMDCEACPMGKELA